LNKSIKVGSLILISAAIIYFVPSFLEKNLAGNRPTVGYNDYLRNQTRDAEFDEDLKKLHDQAEANPKDLVVWKKLSNQIAKKVFSSKKQPAQGLVLELVDSMQHVLDLDPNDTETLLNMGNISYNFEVFDKAAHFLGQYLQIAKDDFNTRSTYASALSFLGKFEEAEKELLYVIAKEPKFFLARANLAITYALSGDKDAANKATKEAIPYAADKITIEKFEGFINQLLSPKETTVNESNQQIQPSQPESDLAALESSIRSNPVAGPKFVFAKSEADTIINLHFANFPMKAMPPFAKEKFLKGIIDVIKTEKLNEHYKLLRFLDHATGDVMEEVKLD